MGCDAVWWGGENKERTDAVLAFLSAWIINLRYKVGSDLPYFEMIDSRLLQKGHFLTFLSGDTEPSEKWKRLLQRMLN